jgi:ribosomal-protein-alanine N-acetyltransferase
MSASKAREIPALCTARLRMREIRQSDAPAVFKLYSDPETVRYWGNELITETAEAEELVRLNLEWVAAGDCYYWAIEHRPSGEVIGTCTIFKIDEKNRRAEIGYILNRNFWGQGLMTEAMNTLIEFSFDTLNLHRLEADTDPNNTASNRLLEKFGFKREGYFRERWFLRGQWLDSDMWGLLKSEYRNGQFSL